MMNLLRLEFRRLFRAKSFYICLAISLVMIIISAATTKMLLNMASSEEFGEAFGSMLQTPTSFSLLKSTASSSLTMVLAIFLSIFVTEDYTADTIKNICVIKISKKGYAFGANKKIRVFIFCAK